MKTIAGTLAMAAFLLAVILSCSEDRGVNIVANTVTVSGKAYGWICDERVLYSRRFGQSATVKFVRVDNCCTTMQQTDSASTYSLAVERGDYSAVVETRHGYPDTVYNIHVDRDTAIDFNLNIDYMDADTVMVYYRYPNPTESLGYAAERQYIYWFDGWTGYMLRPEGARREINVNPDRLMILYHVPMKPTFAPWQVWEEALPWLYGGISLPDAFIFDPGFYPCLDDQEATKSTLPIGYGPE
jgi:hypothetical protein